IPVDVTLTFHEYLWFNLHFLIRRYRWIVYFSLISLVAFLASPAFRNDGDKDILSAYVSGSALLILPAIAFFFFLMVCHAIRRRWQVSSEVREPKKFLFSEKGVEVVGGTNQGTYSWSNIASIIRTRSLVCLGTAEQQYFLIPTNRFTSPNELAQF